MKYSPLVFSAARQFAAVTLFVSVIPVIATADEQFDYSAGGGVVSGTVTYAACGDPEPVSWSITEVFSTSVWTQADAVSVTWLTSWAGCFPIDVSYSGIDDVAPAPTGHLIDHTVFSGFVFTSAGGLNSAITFDPVAHVHEGVPSGGWFGIALLTTLLGIAGIRKLRA